MAIVGRLRNDFSVCSATPLHTFTSMDPIDVNEQGRYVCGECGAKMVISTTLCTVNPQHSGIFITDDPAAPIICGVCSSGINLSELITQTGVSKTPIYHIAGSQGRACSCKVSKGTLTFNEDKDYVNYDEVLEG
jgi:hypothetical protein